MEINTIANVLMVSFFEGPKIIVKREDYEYGKLSDDGKLHLDLKDEKDRAILDLIMRSDIIHVEGITYKIISREYFLDGTALFVNVIKDTSIKQG